MKKTMLLSGVALVGLVASAALPAAAQDSTDEARTEIVVSARKIDESLQNAPVSVTALTEEALDERNIESIDDLSKFAPGLSFSQAFGRSTDRPVVRGQSNVLANVQFGVESGTAYFVDGIYYPTTIQSLDFNLLKRVEVIRGPQSALYGRNSYAGAINFITKDPGDDHFLKLGGTAAEGGEFRYSATAGGPIIGDMLGALVSARYYDYQGQYTNELTGLKVGNEQTWSVNGIVTFKPLENLKARARISYQQDNDGPLALFLQGSAQNNCFPGFRSNFYRSGGVLNSGALASSPGALNNNQYFCGVIQPGPVRLNTSPIGPAANQQDGTAFDGIERTILVTGLTVDWDLMENLTFHSGTGYRTETEKFGTDSDHSDANVFLGSATTTEPLFANTTRDDIRDWSQELRLEWTPSEMFRFMAGGFYYYSENKGREITKTSGEKGVFFGQPSLGAGVGIDPGCTATATCSDKSTVKNWAIFGLAEINPTDTISVTGELRYMEETKGLFQYNGAGVLVFPTVGLSGENKEDYVTPRVTANWQATEDLLLYAVWAKGVKPGGFNGTTGVGVGRPTYAPERASSYELGVKSSWFDNKLTANLSGYLINASSVQLTTAVPSTTAVNSIVTNQGEGRTWGMESEFSFIPNENWAFTATYGYTNPKFTSGCDQDQWIFTSGGGVFFGLNDPRNTSFNGRFGGTASCDITGKRYPLTSKHQASFNVGYTKPVAGGFEFFSNLNGGYESSKFVQVHNTAETGDSFLLGGQIGVRGERWSANIFGRNILNDDTITLATRWFDLRYGGAAAVPPSSLPGLNRIIADGGSATTATTGSPRGLFGSLRRPRQVGIELSYEF